MPSETPDLEARIAHLERQSDELSDEVARLAKALTVAERRIAQLMDREAEREVAAGGTLPFGDERPPHY